MNALVHGKSLICGCPLEWAFVLLGRYVCDLLLDLAYVTGYVCDNSGTDWWGKGEAPLYPPLCVMR